jgi:hypothetical protein
MTRRATISVSSVFFAFALLLVAPAPAQAQEGYVINEFLADPGSYAGGEFIEIFNDTGAPLDVGEYTIGEDASTCTSSDFTDRYTFPEGTTLEDGESATIFDDADQDVPGFHVEDATALSNSGDTVTLCDPNDVVVDTYTYESGEVFAGVSQALIPNANLTNDFQRQDENGAQENVTPGRDNDDGQPLPVEFAGAPTARVDGDAVTLFWRTLTETNNAGFHVQHRRLPPDGDSRPEGSEWTTAEKRVAGAGNSQTAQRYDYTVTGLQPGRYAFRVQQVNADDDKSYSQTVNAAVQADGGFALQAPTRTPFRGETTLTYRAPQGTEVEATLYNSLGQQVQRLQASGGRVAVEARSLSSGLYFVRLTTEEGRTDTQSITLIR